MSKSSLGQRKEVMFVIGAPDGGSLANRNSTQTNIEEVTIASFFKVVV